MCILILRAIWISQTLVCSRNALADDGLVWLLRACQYIVQMEPDLLQVLDSVVLQCQIVQVLFKHGDFLGGGVMNSLQSHSKGLYKDPNDYVNHPKLLFGSFETCSRHIRNYSTAENYFLRLDFRKLSPENE